MLNEILWLWWLSWVTKTMRISLINFISLAATDFVINIFSHIYTLIPSTPKINKFVVKKIVLQKILSSNSANKTEKYIKTELDVGWYIFDK